MKYINLYGSLLFFGNWDSFLMVVVVFDFVVFWSKTRVNEVHMFQPVFFLIGSFS